MIRKSQLFLALAGLVGMNAAMAVCNFTAWGAGTPAVAQQVGNPMPGNPTAADADGVVRRISGQCGLRASAAAQYVEDGTPSAEPAFIARFYVYTGVTGGTATVFNAIADQAGTPDNVVSVEFNGTAFNFKNRTGASGGTLAAAPNKWYAVEIKWARATTNLDVKVQGSAASTGLTGAFTGYSVETPASHGIDKVQLGFVSGTATGEVHVDAYESRRSTDIGRLCRGDATGNNILNVGDRGAVTTEVLGGALAAGQPDCNEDGVVNVGDRGCITTRVLAVTDCLVNP